MFMPVVKFTSLETRITILIVSKDLHFGVFKQERLVALFSIESYLGIIVECTRACFNAKTVV